MVFSLLTYFVGTPCFSVSDYSVFSTKFSSAAQLHQKNGLNSELSLLAQHINTSSEATSSESVKTGILGHVSYQLKSIPILLGLNYQSSTSKSFNKDALGNKHPSTQELAGFFIQTSLTKNFSTSVNYELAYHKSPEYYEESYQNYDFGLMYHNNKLELGISYTPTSDKKITDHLFTEGDKKEEL